jgi:type III restriction enzyme
MFAGQSRTELGVGNRLLLADETLAANTRLLQARDDIELGDASAPRTNWRKAAKSIGAWEI